MAKNKVSEWSSNPANNTDIANIDIAEGCSPSGINNAIREMMAQIKDLTTGGDGDNLAVGGNLSVTGTSTLTGAVTAPSGITIASPSLLTSNVTGNLTGNVTGNLISVSNTVNAGSFIIGNTYVIASLGTPTATDFTLIGAASNTVGVRFTATGVGAGNGTATTFTGRAVNVTGVVAVENGGTGNTEFTQNAVGIGNGTNPFTSVRPSTNGNVLTSKAGATITAGSFVVGTQYTILTVGTTNFTLIGASSNTVGVVFTATGVGSGDGTATTNTWSSEPVTVAALSTATGSAPSYSARAMVSFDAESSAAVTGTYIQSGTTVTVTLTSHGLVAGNRIYVNITSGAGVDGTYTITSVADANTFTYTAGTSLTAAGTVELPRRTILTALNVNSVSYVATGRFIVNFLIPMPDANYILTGNSGSPGFSASGNTTISPSDFIAGAAAVQATDATSNTYQDNAYNSVVIFR
jgi:hypothetical protein